MICVLIFTIISYIISLENIYNFQLFLIFPNMNLVSEPMTSDSLNGQFNGADLQIIFNESTLSLTIIQFLEILLILTAIYTQWHIDSEYTIKYELVLIGIVWFICNSSMTFIHLIDWPKITLNDVRWWDFTFIFFRSIFSISISCIKNIYDSYKPENQIIIAPPNREKI